MIEERPVLMQMAEHPDLLEHVAEALVTGDLGGGARAMMRVLWERNGEPFESFGVWLEKLGVLQRT